MRIQRRVMNRFVRADDPASFDRFLFELDLQIDDICRSINHTMAAAPTNGTYERGDRVYNSAPASGGYVGWVCTAAGSPGTWAAFGLIA